MAKKTPKPPAPKYSYTITGKKVNCHTGSGGQTVLGLWEAEELSSFHDAELAKATKEINAILNDLQKKHARDERTLSFVEFQNRHFLVWANYGAVSPYDSDKKIAKALKLKVK